MDDKMKLEITPTKTTEVFASNGDITATCTPWANMEGCNVLVQEGRQTILHGSLRWEELELLNAVTAAAKAV